MGTEEGLLSFLCRGERTYPRRAGARCRGRRPAARSRTLAATDAGYVFRVGEVKRIAQVQVLFSSALVAVIMGTAALQAASGRGDAVTCASVLTHLRACRKEPLH